MERYRSGHNEAVLKTVCPKGHMGSNPILSATLRGFAECGNKSIAKFSFLWHLEDYPSGEGAPLLRE